MGSGVTHLEADDAAIAALHLRGRDVVVRVAVQARVVHAQDAGVRLQPPRQLHRRLRMRPMHAAVTSGSTPVKLIADFIIIVDMQSFAPKRKASDFDKWHAILLTFHSPQ